VSGGIIDGVAKRVLMVLHDLRVGGAERVVLRLAGAFAERGADVELITLGGGGPLERELAPGVRHTALAARRVRTAAPSLARHLRRTRPDVVIATLPHVNVIAAAAHRLAGSRARLLLREANDPTFEHPRRGPGAWLARLAYARADVVVALTHGNAAAIRRVLRVRAERVEVIPNPAPSPASLGALDARGAPRGFPDDAPPGRPRLLCVARLTPQKDHATLLEAFELVRDTFDDAVLALVGDGPQRAAIEARIVARGLTDRVHLAGTVVDTGPWWSWADLLLLTSRWEGFPNVLLEALQHGVPMVATDCPTGPREVLDGTRVGELVRVGDAGAVAAAALRLLADPPDPAALRRRAADFALDGIAERWWRLLERPS